MTLQKTDLDVGLRVVTQPLEKSILLARPSIQGKSELSDFVVRIEEAFRPRLGQDLSQLVGVGVAFQLLEEDHHVLSHILGLARHGGAEFWLHTFLKLQIKLLKIN